MRLDDLVLSYSQLRDAAGLFLAVTLIAAGGLLLSGLGLMHARRRSGGCVRRAEGPPAPVLKSRFSGELPVHVSAAYVLAGGVAEGGVPLAAQGRRLDVRSGPGVRPRGPVFPP